MKILITGAQGQLGCEIADAVSKVFTSNKYIFTDFDDLDITSQQQVQTAIVDGGVQVVVNCAAYTAVDRAQDDQHAAYKINAEACRLLAGACKRVGATFIHISTDYVFDGSASSPLTEEQTTNPIGVYGLSKRQGEEEIEKSGVASLILRTSWLYSNYGTNFVKTILRLSAKREELRVVSDQRGTPTYAADLASFIVNIIESGAYSQSEGIYHFSNEGDCSWYEFAQEITKIAGRKNCKILPCSSDEFPSKVRRPSYSVLSKNKIKTDFSVELRTWQEALTECLKSNKN